MSDRQCEIGIVGLGVMGRNLALNVADHGFAVTGLDRDPAKVALLRQEASARPAVATHQASEFVRALRTPRALMLLVPAGPAVDAVAAEFSPLLSPGDLIIDAGNSQFRDTERRQAALTAKSLHFMGMGVSGGESGARHGPSLMPGGAKEAYARVEPILKAIAARVGDDACVEYLGPGSAGHYVKMVHNGIEYGLMQLIAECYDLMRRGLGMTNDELAGVFGEWNRQELSSFLIEITAEVFRKQDDLGPQRLVDVISDAARQKGTGKWTSQDAMELQVPIPTIDAAVAVRGLSDMQEQRRAAARALAGPKDALLPGERKVVIQQIRQALYAGVILTYAQGFSLLRAASKEHGYGASLETVARIWRGGCIIRAALLEDIRAAYRQQADLPHLLLDVKLGRAVSAATADLRTVVGHAVRAGIGVPALMASLAYFDGFRCERLPTNLIQAQRDYFGAHTYERTDRPGTFHANWS